MFIQMGLQFNGNNMKRKTPVKRNNMFFDGDDFNLELEFGREYVEHDANQTIVLYEVDLENTQVDDIYKEAVSGNIRFKTPVELPVVFELEDPELKTYDKQQMKGYYVKVGKLTFSVYTSTLEEYGCDIKRGDYIGLQVDPNHMEFFTVADDGRVNFNNKNTMYGTVPYYRTVVCAPVDNNEFEG